MSSGTVTGVTDQCAPSQDGRGVRHVRRRSPLDTVRPMRTALATVTLLLFALTTACGSSGAGDSGHKPKPKSPTVGDRNAALVEKRYSECLTKLKAKRDQALTNYVTYDVPGQQLLTFHIVKRSGKTYTMPDKVKDQNILATAGC